MGVKEVTNSKGSSDSVGTMSPLPEPYCFAPFQPYTSFNHGKPLTFMTATWPVESGVVNAGLFPSVLIVSMGLERTPS